ncbi:MAG: YbhB/YbcL family Raf kinase inhibitor-like protein [Minisyncoccia bacterium]
MILFAALGAVALWALSRQGSREPKITTMIIASPSFENGGMIPAKFTCDGSGTSPELRIEGVPTDAKSLALIMHDPDAPRAGGFTHWVVWNINPATTAIAENGVPPGSVGGRNDAGRAGYVGPCPPSGTHHYEFHLYALDAVLHLASTSGKAELEAATSRHLLAETELVGLYAREN